MKQRRGSTHTDFHSRSLWLLSLMPVLFFWWFPNRHCRNVNITYYIHNQASDECFVNRQQGLSMSIKVKGWHEVRQRVNKLESFFHGTSSVQRLEQGIQNKQLEMDLIWKPFWTTVSLVRKLNLKENTQPETSTSLRNGAQEWEIPEAESFPDLGQPSDWWRRLKWENLPNRQDWRSRWVSPWTSSE